MKQLYENYPDCKYWIQQFKIEYKLSFKKKCKHELLKELLDNIKNIIG